MRPINTPNCNSIRPVVFAQGSGDLASRHVCELSSNHEHSPWLWLTNRHDDEKHAALLKLRSAKMNRPINSGKRVDGVDRFSAESSRSTELTKVESIDFQSSWVDLFDSIDFKVYLLLITVHQLCMLNTEHIVSTVKCKFNSQKCYSVGCCFVLGWWVQCHVLCQQWYFACWSWWNTQSYKACCGTGDTQFGTVNYSFKKFLKLFLKISGEEIEFGSDRLTMFMILIRNEQIVRNTVIWSLMLYWRHSTWLDELYL